MAQTFWKESRGYSQGIGGLSVTARVSHSALLLWQDAEIWQLEARTPELVVLEKGVGGNLVQLGLPAPNS